MALSGWSADRLAATLVYLVLSGSALWGGIGLINRSLETKFYKDYLVKWELGVEAFAEKGGRWPEFTGNNHLNYMDQVVKRMKRLGIQPPRSNRSRPYTYRLDLLGKDPQEIFLLCFPARMVIFGMDERTFFKVDRYVDGRVGLKEGRFTGRRAKKAKTITAQWRVE